MQTHHLLQLVPNRVAATVERLQGQIWTRVREIAVEATESNERHTIWSDALSQPRSKALRGSPWGRLYDQRWCRLELLNLAQDLPGELHLEWRDQAEATLYVDGVPYFGFDVAHRYCPLPPRISEVWVESVCVQTGIWHPEATGLSPSGSVFEGAS